MSERVLTPIQEFFDKSKWWEIEWESEKVAPNVLPIEPLEITQMPHPRVPGGGQIKIIVIFL